MPPEQPLNQQAAAPEAVTSTSTAPFRQDAMDIDIPAGDAQRANSTNETQVGSSNAVAP